MTYDDIARAHGWIRLKRGWYHPAALQYWGWPEPLCYKTAKQLCEAENLEDIMTFLRKGCKYREFRKGEKVSVLPDCIGEWMDPGRVYEIAKVDNHGFIREVGHRQSLIMTTGDTFSAWWFDDNCMSHEERRKAQVE